VEGSEAIIKGSRNFTYFRETPVEAILPGSQPSLVPKCMISIHYGDVMSCWLIDFRAVHGNLNMGN
jgi:hypothetical protein